jgi:N-ethylmaleimide reductase
MPLPSGRLFIANPNLVERIQGYRRLNPPDRSTFYGGGAHGYSDYAFREVAA